VLLGLDADLWYGFGEDFGRLGDLSVDVLIEEGRDLTNRVRLQVELSNCPFEQQRQIVFYILDRVPRFRAGAMDATGNGQYLAEVAAQRYGPRIEQVKLNDAWYLEHMPRFRAALQDGTLDAIPRDAQTRDDLRAIRQIDGTPKLPKSKTQTADGPKLQRHGDAAIALVLGHAAMRREVVPMEFQALGRKRAAAGLADYIG
jgi:phage FluMu gp28-like protein